MVNLIREVNTIPRKSRLKNAVLGVSMLGLIIGASGCASSPLDLLPRSAQPAFYRDYKDKQAEYRRREEMETLKEKNRNIPDNVYRDKEGRYNPAPGYVWANPKDPNDLRVQLER